MSAATELYHRAAALGLRLQPHGDKLAVRPGSRLPPDLAAELRQHKAELLDLLQAKAGGLSPDCAPWLHVARQVLAGEFDGATISTVESLTIGLRAINHSACRSALERLPDNKKKHE